MTFSAKHTGTSKLSLSRMHYDQLNNSEDKANPLMPRGNKRGSGSRHGHAMIALGSDEC